MGVTWQEKRQARQQDLFEYLITNQRDKVEVDGNSLRLLSNKSISIKKGYAGYKDFANGDTGNGVDFLVKYLGFGFVDAVNALNNKSIVALISPGVQKENQFHIPKRADDNGRIISYLSVVRGIDKQLINWLISKGVLYQEQYYCNCVFINKDNSFYEKRGIYDEPYHRNNDKSIDNTNFWYFNNPNAKLRMKAFICESAIDAMSLCQLRPDEGLYFSIAGVGNQQRIDRIKELVYEERLQVYTAFDNDEAGELARDRNKDLKHIVPNKQYKDWNEQLQKEG